MLHRRRHRWSDRATREISGMQQQRPLLDHHLAVVRGVLGVTEARGELLVQRAAAVDLQHLRRVVRHRGLRAADGEGHVLRPLPVDPW